MRKLNNQTIKDVQSLPRIEDSLDCLDGTTIFTSLDLQSGYWQVDLTEASKPLTNFTVTPLGFCECLNALWSDKCTGHISMPDGVMLGGNASQMVYHLSR